MVGPRSLAIPQRAKPEFYQSLLIKSEGIWHTNRIALIVGALGLLWRVMMVVLGAPPANSDEATAGLAAIHIAQGRDYPIFFYGQHYMGTIQSYLAAPLVAAFGPSTVVLRIPPLAEYAIFVFLMHRFATHVFGARTALATVVVLAFGADRVIGNQLLGGGGYSELPAMLAALFLLAVGLARRSYQRPLLMFALWGFIFGLAAWTHWLAAPYLVGAASVLIATSWRSLLGLAGLATGAAMLVGATPLIWYNATAPSDASSIAVLRDQMSLGGSHAYPARLAGGVIAGLPMASGLCGPGQCRPDRLWWGPILLLLLTVAVAWSGTALLRRPATDRVRRVTTIALSLSAVLTIVLYVKSPAAAENPSESSRYLHYLVVSTPVWIWVLERLITEPARRLTRVLAATLACAVALTMVVATAELVGRSRDYHSWALENDHLARALESGGVADIYGGYWTCNRVIFQTSEQVRCAVLDDTLRPGLNRYPAYLDDVAGSSRPPAFLINVDSGAKREPEFDTAVRALLVETAVPFQATQIGGYILYQPSKRVPLP